MKRGSYGANALVVMAKAPLPGEVKTRLVPPLTAEEAAELYGCLLKELLGKLKNFQKADLFLTYTPAGAVSVLKNLAPDCFSLFPQQGEHLGERMLNAFSVLFRQGYQKVVLVGSDLPGLPVGFIEESFAALERQNFDLVLGPTDDGGYYLMGLRSLIGEIFQSISWGNSTVLAATTFRLQQLGLKPYFIPGWQDVDVLEDLENVASLEFLAVPLRQKVIRLLRVKRGGKR